MSPRLFFLLSLVLLGPVAARAQLGGFDLNKLSKAVDTAKDAGKLIKGVAGVGPQEEALIGDSVALEIIGQYGGLVRDPDIMRRVNLLGRALARYSDRPQLDWRFGVLDSATVNAFSAPAGYVFITRGLYDQATNDDLLAAILGHEIAHITNRHALKIVARGDFLSGATSFAAKRSSDVRQVEAQLSQFDLGIGQITKTLFEKGFDPQTEYAADKDGRALAVTTGYAPGGLRAVLSNLKQAGENRKTMFSSHPPVTERIKRLPNEPVPVVTEPAAPTADAEDKPDGETK